MEHIFALPAEKMTSTLEKSINIQISHATDIGGGRENQDDFFIFQNPEEKITVVAILDGHGLEHGKLASGSAREFLTIYFETNYLLLKTNPYEILVKAYSEMHNHIKESFKQSLTNNNYKVMETQEGYLLKRYTDNQPWQSLRGGTTCTIIAIIDNMMYCSNVGDSTATLCSKVPIFNPEKQLTYLGDSATPSSTPFKKSLSSTAESEESIILSTTMEIIANHSPDNPSEFCRLRQFQQRLGNPLQPASHLVYDSKLNDKVRCSPIFTVDSAGNPTITNNGTYCKNVRYELATLLTTPSSARFSESLAFTRSVGDFYLQTYGVTYCPEIYSIDLETLFDDLDKNDKEKLLCLVVASDGVWDNWKYEDVTDFVLSDVVLESSNKKDKTAAELLIKQNDVFAKANFGNSSDNATAIVVYLNK